MEKGGMFHVKHQLRKVEEQLKFYGDLLGFSQNFVYQSLEYFQLLLNHNQKVNLISRKDEENLVHNHWIHSMAVVKVTDWGGVKRVVDLGTGGGLPGVLLALFFPEKKFILVDSIRKKTDFLELVKDRLKLTNVSIYNDRIENLTSELKNSAEIITARAVSDLNQLWKWSEPLLIKGGRLIAWKGDIKEELSQFRKKFSNYKEIEICGSTLELDVPKLLNMHFVIIQK